MRLLGRSFVFILVSVMALVVVVGAIYLVASIIEVVNCGPNECWWG